MNLAPAMQFTAGITFVEADFNVISLDFNNKKVDHVLVIRKFLKM